jgi:hypothetical protein
LAISIFAAGCSRVHVHGVRSGASAGYATHRRHGTAWEAIMRGVRRSR